MEKENKTETPKPSGSKIEYMVEYSNDAAHGSPEYMLETTLEEYRHGKRAARKMVIIMLDDEGDAYDSTMRQCGLHNSEILSLLEWVKSDVLDMMAGRK